MIRLTTWFYNRRAAATTRNNTVTSSASSSSSSSLMVAPTPPPSYRTVASISTMDRAVPTSSSRVHPENEEFDNPNDIAAHSNNTAVVNWRRDRIAARAPPALPPRNHKHSYGDSNSTNSESDTNSTQEAEYETALNASHNTPQSAEAVVVIPSMTCPLIGRTGLFTITGNYVWCIEPFDETINMPIVLRSPIFDTDSPRYAVQFSLSRTNAENINLSIGIIIGGEGKPYIHTCRVTYSANVYAEDANVNDATPGNSRINNVYTETVTTRPGKWHYTPIFSDLVERHRASSSRRNLFPNNTLRLSIKLIGYSTTETTARVSNENTKQYRICENIQQWWLSHEFSDIQIIIHGGRLPAHRIILASASNVFRVMLKRGFSEGNTGRIRILDFPPDAVRDMLRYIYNRELRHLDSLAVYIFCLANFYELPGLREISKNSLIANINDDNSCEIWSLGDLYDSPEMRITAIQYIKRNIHRVRLTKDYQHGTTNLYKGLLEDVFCTLGSRMNDIASRDTDSHDSDKVGISSTATAMSLANNCFCLGTDDAEYTDIGSPENCSASDNRTSGSGNSSGSVAWHQEFDQRAVLYAPMQCRSRRTIRS